MIGCRHDGTQLKVGEDIERGRSDYDNEYLVENEVLGMYSDVSHQIIIPAVL